MLLTAIERIGIPAASSAGNAATAEAPNAGASNAGRAGQPVRMVEGAARLGAQAQTPPHRSGEPKSAPRTITLCVQVRLGDAPAWFGGVARRYAESKRAAWRAVQARSKEDKGSVATLAYRSADATLPSKIRSQLAIEVDAEWRSHKRLWRQGRERRPPTAMTATPRFVVHGSVISVIPEAKILLVKARKSTGEWAEIEYECGEKQDAQLLGALRYGETEFQWRAGRWFAHLSIQLLPADYHGHGVCALRSRYEPLLDALAVWPGGLAKEWKHGGWKYWRTRQHFRIMRAKAKNKKKLRMRLHLRGREARWANTETHKMAARTVQWLRKNSVGVLLIGRHKNIRQKEQGKKYPAKSEKNWKSAHWSFAMLLDRVSYKALLAGITVVILDEKKMRVRSTCWKCGEDVDEERGIVSCRCGMRATHRWNSLRNLLVATGWDGEMHRIPADAPIAQASEGFLGSAFGVPDMLERLEWATKAR